MGEQKAGSPGAATAGRLGHPGCRIRSFAEGGERGNVAA
jgi:hypothetical protein